MLSWFFIGKRTKLCSLDAVGRPQDGPSLCLASVCTGEIAMLKVYNLGLLRLFPLSYQGFSLIMKTIEMLAPIFYSSMVCAESPRIKNLSFLRGTLGDRGGSLYPFGKFVKC